MGAYRGWGGPSYRAYGSGGGGFGWALTPIVKKLILLNVAVFLLTLVLQLASPPLAGTFVDWFGLVPQSFLLEFRLWQPLTYLFLHGGFAHIFFNMFGLWMFGGVLERDWGRRRFLRYYLATGAGAGLFSVLVTTMGVKLGWLGPGGATLLQIPTIGASGAIYGILLAFGLLYPRQPVFLWFILPVPARLFVLIFGVLTLFSALNAPGSGVSHVAHLGGMLIGLVYLRGGGLFRGIRRGFAEWQLRRRRRDFEVYLREEDHRSRDLPRPDRWIN